MNICMKAIRAILKVPLLLLIALASLWSVPSAFAVAKTWAGTTTDWNTGSNWSPVGVPGSVTADTVTIPTGQAAYPDLTAAAGFGISSLTIDRKSVV